MSIFLVLVAVNVKYHLMCLCVTVLGNVPLWINLPQDRNGPIRLKPTALFCFSADCKYISTLRRKSFLTTSQIFVDYLKIWSQLNIRSNFFSNLAKDLKFTGIFRPLLNRQSSSPFPSQQLETAVELCLSKNLSNLIWTWT